MTSDLPQQRHRALVMLLLATLFWGLSFPVVKAMGLLQAKILPEASTWFSTLYIVAPRFVLAAALMALWRPRAFWQFTAGEWKQGLMIGCFGAAGILLQNDGLRYTAASTSAFLTQLYAILIPVYLAVRARRNPGPTVWVCGALVLAGVAILGRFDWQSWQFGRGEWETLLCSVFFMGQILWLDKKEYAASRPAQLSFIAFATQGFIFAVLALIATPGVTALTVPWTSAPWVIMTLILTIFCTLGAYSLMNAWQPKISATEAGLIYCVEPIFGSMMALFLPAWLSGWGDVDYPNEMATFSLIVGGTLITVANILIQLRRPRAG